MTLEDLLMSAAKVTECQWCGCDDRRKLVTSLRFDPVPRFIVFCTSCRAREKDGQLDDQGKPTGKFTR